MTVAAELFVELAEVLGAPVTTNADDTTLSGFHGQVAGVEIRGILNGDVITIGAAIATSLMVCIGACEFPFVVPIATGGRTDVFAHEPYLAFVPAALEAWLGQDTGRAWLATINLAADERLEATLGWGELVVRPRSKSDLERVMELMTALLLLPRLEQAPDEQDLSSLDPQLLALATTFAHFVESDDDRRGERIATANTAVLRDLVDQGRPVLSRIDAALDDLERRVPIEPAAQDGVVALHALAQAIIEAAQELQRRSAEGRITGDGS